MQGLSQFLLFLTAGTALRSEDLTVVDLQKQCSISQQGWV